MKKGAITWEFVSKLILAAVILVILITMFYLIQKRMYGGEDSILETLRNLFKLRG